QTGTITFAAATRAATPGASVVARQAASGPGTIVLDGNASTALANGSGDVRLTAGTGGIRAAGGGAAIPRTGRAALAPAGGVGSAAHRVPFDATPPAAVVVGSSSAPGGGVYLGGLGSLTLGDVRTANAPLDVTAAAALAVATNATLDTGCGTI